MPGLVWWVWIVLAGALGLAELHLPGSYLIWIALGAVVAGAADAAFDLSLSAQILTFVTAAAVSSLIGYFVYRSFAGRGHNEPALNERNQLMIGARGTVCEAFRHGQGKVRLGDGVWLAAGPDMTEDTPVVVTSVRGTRLHVQALQSGQRQELPAADTTPE
jgi:hypothetical protein